MRKLSPALIEVLEAAPRASRRREAIVKTIRRQLELGRAFDAKGIRSAARIKCTLEMVQSCLDALTLRRIIEQRPDGCYAASPLNPDGCAAALRAVVREKGQISMREAYLETAVSMSYRAVEMMMKRLQSEGFVEKTGHGRFSIVEGATAPIGDVTKTRKPRAGAGKRSKAKATPSTPTRKLANGEIAAETETSPALRRAA